MNKQYSQPVRRNFRPKLSNKIGVVTLLLLCVIVLVVSTNFA